MYEARKCAILRFPVVLSIYSTLCGIIVLAIERTIATLKYRTYEVCFRNMWFSKEYCVQANGCRAVGLALIAGQWLVCIVVAIFSVLLRSDPGYVHYCTAYISHPRTSVFSLCFMSALEVITLVYFVCKLSPHSENIYPTIFQCYYNQTKGDKSMNLWTRRCIPYRKDINFR